MQIEGALLSTSRHIALNIGLVLHVTTLSLFGNTILPGFDLFTTVWEFAKKASENSTKVG